MGSGQPANGVFPETDVSFSFSCRIAIDGDRARYEYEGPEWDLNVRDFLNSRHIGVWDGKIGKTFQDRAEMPTGSIDQYCLELGRPHVLPLRMALRMMSLNWYQLDLGDYVLADGTELIDGAACLVLETRGSQRQLLATQGRRPSRICYWIDPAQDFSIRRVSRSIDGHSRPGEDLHIAYERDRNGIWYPSRWVYALDSSDPPNTRIEATVTECVINEQVDSSQFDYEFPSGAMVRDARTSELYIARAGGAKRLITDAEARRNTPYEDLVATDSGEARKGIATTRRNRVWWAIGSLVIVFVVGYLIFARARTRRRRLQ